MTTLEQKLVDAVIGDDVEAVAALLKRGGSINQISKDGASILQIACLRGNTEMACFLIARNADVNKAGPNGRTPLIEAVAMGYVDIAGALLEHNADVNAATISGWTSLMFAAKSNYIDLAHMLFAKDADAMLRNTNNHAADHIAEGVHWWGMVTLIRDKQKLQIVRSAEAEALAAKIAASTAVSTKKQQLMRAQASTYTIRRRQP